jgi:hypothetical protein
MANLQQLEKMISLPRVLPTLRIVNVAGGSIIIPLRHVI